MTVNNLHTVVTRATDAERRWLMRYLSFDDASTQFRRLKNGRVKHQKATKIELYSDVTESFPTGLLSLVAGAMKKGGAELCLIDRRKAPCECVNGPLDWLRPYQATMVDKGVERHQGIYHAATGSGKSEVIIALVEELPCTWLLLTHRANLVSQAAARYHLRTGLDAQVWRKGHKVRERFVLATFQTLHAALKAGDPEALKLINTVEGLLVDEVHTVAATTFYSVVMKAKAAYFRFGFSGTPLARGDSKSIMVLAALGPVIYRVKSHELAEEGYLAKPKIRLYKCEQGDVEYLHYADAYRALITNSVKRNKLLLRLSKLAAKPCLVFVQHIKHGQLLQKLLKGAGVAAHFVYGNAPESVRTAAIKKLEHREIDVLISTVILIEGVDVPSLESVILGLGGKSIIRTLQGIGRGSRTDSGRKATFEVYDVYDAGNKWLEKHSKERRKTYLKEKWEVVLSNP